MVRVDVTNKPGTQGAFGVTVEVTLPSTFTVTRTEVNRGSGCSAGGPGLICDLDWLSSSIPGRILIWGTVGQATQLELKAFVHEFWAEGNWDDNTAKLTLLPAAPTPPASSGGVGGGSQQSPPATAKPPAPTTSAAGGATLKTPPLKWKDTPSNVSYQWQLCSTTSCTTIAGAIKPSLKLQPSFTGSSVRLVATATINGARVKSTSPTIAVRAVKKKR
jgi:hypothetical protein